MMEGNGGRHDVTLRGRNVDQLANSAIAIDFDHLTMVRPTTYNFFLTAIML